MRRLKLYYLLVALLPFTFMHAEEEAEDQVSSEVSNLENSGELSGIISKTFSRRKNNKLKRQPIHDSTDPYYVPLKSLQSDGSVFFQSNVGLGLLYFRRPKGNFSMNPNGVLPLASVPLKRGFAYNRTPLYEYLIGYRFYDWLRVSLSYQNQSGIFFQTDKLPFVGNSDLLNRTAQFRSYLALNSVMVKAFIELPFALAWRKALYSPFFAVGMGAGWQTWYGAGLYNQHSPYASGDIYFKPKNIANCVFVIDKGLRIQSLKANAQLSGFLGFKYMFWGQARNLGKLEQQGSGKAGFFKPFKIKTIYSFVPYLGFQWDFPATRDAYPSLKRLPAGQHDSFSISTQYMRTSPALIASMNIGPNFLYFSGIQGNMGGKPAANFTFSGQDAPYSKKFGYNRTPLYEYLIGYRYNTYFDFGLSVQNQTNTVIQTPWTPSFATQASITNSRSVFRAYLNLTSLMVKVKFSLPVSLRAGFTAFTPTLALGFGPSWQSWNDLTNYQLDLQNGVLDAQNNLVLRQKAIVNPSFMVDLGFNIKNLSPYSLYNIQLGCKYNQWGQIRNLGKISQQGNYKKGFHTPLSVKTLYSFTPYIGFQWDFPVSLEGNVARLDINTWKPYIARVEELEKPIGLFVSMNFGPNFLRFNKVRGNLGGIPAALFTQTGSSPYEGRLRKNTSLLFEYLAGYQMNYWFKPTLSFQAQQGLYLETKAIAGAGSSSANPSNQFRAHLSLYSLMLKLYFETPKAVIMKSFATTPYFGIAFGPSWQSWEQMEVYKDTNLFANNFASMLQLKPKTCQNVGFMLDLGARIRNAVPNFGASVTLGCKLNFWGQARNLGKQDQQWNNFRTGLAHPVQIKTLYSFAPYLGFQWNF